MLRAEVWDNANLGVAFNTPVVKDGFLYGNESKSGSLLLFECQDRSKMLD